MAGLLWLLGIVISSLILAYGLMKGIEWLIAIGFILLPIVLLSIIRAVGTVDRSGQGTS